MRDAMKMIKHVLLILAVSISSGCSTIHFINGDPQTRYEEMSEWHHTAAFRLLEVSDPVDMSERCRGNEWNTITTERTFINGLAGIVDSLILGVDVWEPYTVFYTCR